MADRDADLSDIDLMDKDAFQAQQHHDWLRRLRASGNGIHWMTEPDGPGFWAVTRHDHIREVSRHPERFSSNKGGTQIVDNLEPDAQMRRDSIMLDMDAPRHTRYRKLVNKGFTPRMIGLLESYLRNRTQRIVDAVCERGEADFVTDLSAELPLQAIAEMLGVPVEDRSKIFEWTNAMIGADDPDFSTDRADVDRAFGELYEYSHRLQTERRNQPADDIVTTLLGAEIDGDALSEFEFDMFFLLLCVAGNETTRNTASWGMLEFLRRPEEWQRFCADPDGLMPTTVEEITRWASPVLHFRRTATIDTELAGTAIREGDKVVIWYISGNRDERVFADPYTFDITRSPNDHIGFGGGGPHFCLGANLARMEIRLLFNELATRLPDMALAGEPTFLRSNFIGGIKRLPVTFTPTPSTHTSVTAGLGVAEQWGGQGYGHRVDS